MSTVSKSFVLILVVLFLASLVTLQLATVKASPKTITVPDDYPTIQAAVGNASAGDTVFVREGVYNLSSFGPDGIYIDKPISLIGQDSQKTIISKTYYRYTYNVIHIAADNVTISGFTITDSFGLVGIRVETPTDSEFQPSGINITGNIISGQNDGILTYGGENYVVSKNNIIGNDIGVSFSSSNSVISDNNITDSGMYGLSVDSCKNVVIKGNNITDNGFKSSTASGGSKDVDQGGLSLDGDSNQVYQNNITNNLIGIQLYVNNNNSAVYSNNILNNQIGINLENMMLFAKNQIGSNTKIYNNNFIYNLKNAFVWHTNRYWNVTAYNETYGEGEVVENGTSLVFWDNSKVGNYWSDYNDQGVYAIDENNIDHYPLAQKVDISVSTNTPPPLNLSLIIPIVAIVIFAVFVLSFSLYRRHRKAISQNEPNV